MRAAVFEDVGRPYFNGTNWYIGTIFNRMTQKFFDVFVDEQFLKGKVPIEVVIEDVLRDIAGLPVRGLTKVQQWKKHRAEEKRKQREAVKEPV